MFRGESDYRETFEAFARKHPPFLPLRSAVIKAFKMAGIFRRSQASLGVLRGKKANEAHHAIATSAARYIKLAIKRGQGNRNSPRAGRAPPSSARAFRTWTLLPRVNLSETGCSTLKPCACGTNPFRCYNPSLFPLVARARR